MASILQALPMCQLDWALTLQAVQDNFRTLHQRVSQLEKQGETLQGRGETASPTSSKPPSSDSPFHKPNHTRLKSWDKRGAHKGYPGTSPKFLTPTEVHLSEPGPCACGHGVLVSLTPDDTQQVIDLPPIEMDSTPLILQQEACGGRGTRLKAQVPSAY
jgi:hypothetical protein